MKLYQQFDSAEELKKAIDQINVEYHKSRIDAKERDRRQYQLIYSNRHLSERYNQLLDEELEVFEKTVKKQISLPQKTSSMTKVGTARRHNIVVSPPPSPIK